ncbi:MAG: Ig-like domain-containing protein [Paludibacteraceae bacterium]|nr:Ig-like domain-containing protein [Paludibacteraceae bacterium]
MKANKFFAIALAALTLGFVACKKDEPQQDKLKVTPEVAEVSVGATVQLSANLEVTWSSSDEAIAGVNASGLVTGIKEGEVNISAKAVKTNEVAVCKVTVKAGGVTPPPAIPEIDVTDGTLADWEALPADKVVSWECPDDAAMLGLKGVAVYATEMYISILVEPNMDDITDLEWVPFHVYIDLDNSDATGGYGDEFADANTDILCESAIFSAGEPYPYNPAVFKWWGEVGADGWEWTDPSVEHDGSDFWGAIIGEGQLPVGNSECVDGKFEIQLLRELLATVHDMNDSEFGIGFDIQQNWSSVGILPCGSATDENPSGKVAKLKVKINK